MTTVTLKDGRSGELTMETITPAKARRMVRTSRGLRLHCTKRTKIIMYENLIRQGKWRPGKIVIHGDFVVVGRHALAAIANCDVSQEMWVLRVPVPGSSHPELR